MHTGGHGHILGMGNLGVVSSCANTPVSCTDTHKSNFFHINKYVREMVIMNDLE